jgi:drug/metabolite transporter (DMT)-like permease
MSNDSEINKKHKIIAIISVILCTFMTTLGQIFWKLGASNAQEFISFINLYVILGLIAYGLGSVLLIVALKFWELSSVHPFLALGFIWITILGPLIVGEVLTIQRLSGIFIIILGVVSIGR